MQRDTRNRDLPATGSNGEEEEEGWHGPDDAEEELVHGRGVELARGSHQELISSKVVLVNRGNDYKQGQPSTAREAKWTRQGWQSRQQQQGRQQR